MKNNNKLLSIPKQTRSDFITYGIVILAFAVIQPLLSAKLLSNSMSGQLVPICAYIVMAVSLNLTVGILGELSLGHAGFVSLGAFSGIITIIGLESAVPSAILRYILAMLVGGIVAGIAGFLIGIPVLRLNGDYLAIVTLAFGEIIKNIVNCLYVGIDKNGLHVSMSDAESLHMEQGKVILNGPMGAVGVPKLSTFVLGIILVMISLIVVLNIKRSRTGRAIMSLRDNKIAAESVGISVTKYKLTAFIISAVLAGMSGVLYAMNYTTITARKFDFNMSILVLVFVVLGGMGNIRGSIIATAVLYVLPELLREYADYRMLIYAVILIIVMLFTNSAEAILFRQRTVAWFKKLLNKESDKSTRKGEAK